MIMRRLWQTVLMGLLLSPAVYGADQSLSTRAMLEPLRQAKISSELAGRINAINVRNGDGFRKGDVLIQYDCALYQADLDAAKAELASASAQLANNRQLLTMKSVSKLDVELARFEKERQAARVKSSSYKVSRCSIKAPFNGRVVELAVNAHESVENGKELVWLLDDTELEVNLVIPSSWLSWLQPGRTFDFLVDETGERFIGEVIRIGSLVDAVSQSIHITGKLESPSNNLVAGMSGLAQFDQQRPLHDADPESGN